MLATEAFRPPTRFVLCRMDTESPRIFQMLLTQLLWSDPCEKRGVRSNTRSQGILFGPDVTQAFMEKNHLRRGIIRSHEVVQTGLRLQQNGRLITVFRFVSLRVLLFV